MNREDWLAEGVPATHLDELERFAHIGQWDILWQSSLSKQERRLREYEGTGPGKEPGIFLTRVRCPKCGSCSTYQLDAVSDFHCDEDEDCGYDYIENPDGLQPLPGDW